MMMGRYFFSFILLSFSVIGSVHAQEHRAVAVTDAVDFKYQQTQLDNAVNKAKSTIDDMFRRLENVEDNQQGVISCARQDSPTDPDSYAIWDNGKGKCVTLTRGCVPVPQNPIESRELVFIFDASSSMEQTYSPPTVPHNCKPYYERYVDECGSKYYPSFKQQHPVKKECGNHSSTKFCKWCGYKPSAPKEKVVIDTIINGEGLEEKVYGYQFVTEGPEWEKYLDKKEKYDNCVQHNAETDCVNKYNQCKSEASTELSEDIEAYNEAYQAWKNDVYDPYKVCRHEQYKEYTTCVNDFNKVWNTSKPEPRISAAKKAVKDSIKKAPTFVELGLVVFNGCENVVNHGFYLDADRTDLLKAVDAIDASGSTPLVDSMLIAAENMKIKSETVNAEGYIVLVTDGEDTCVSKDSAVAMKSVCDTAKALKKENEGLVINVMDLSNNSKLSCISEFTGGVYASVSSESTMLSAIVGEMSKISDVPEYCYAPSEYAYEED